MTSAKDSAVKSPTIASKSRMFFSYADEGFALPLKNLADLSERLALLGPSAVLLFGLQL